MGVPEWGVYEELFNSDEERFGGSGVVNTGKIKCQDEPWNGREQSVVVRVPPLAGMVLKRTGALRRPAKKTAAKTTAAKTTTKAAGTKTKAAAKTTAAKTATTKKAPAKKAPAQKSAARKKASEE